MLNCDLFVEFLLRAIRSDDDDYARALISTVTGHNLAFCSLSRVSGIEFVDKTFLCAMAPSQRSF